MQLKQKYQWVASSETCAHNDIALSRYEYTWTLTLDGTEVFETTDIQQTYCYMQGQNVIYDNGLHDKIDHIGVSGGFTYKLVENSVPILEFN